MKHILKEMVSKLDCEKIERALALALLGGKFSASTSASRFETRETLWDKTLSLLPSPEILYLEFGVWKGHSLNYFVAHNAAKGSKFVGFDSFEGLPEDWVQTGVKAGDFHLGGELPKSDDPRVTFVKGWFQDTVPGVISELLKHPRAPNMIVHYDGDLYSSTLFCLTEIDRFKVPYLAVFDEFYGHEARALDSYMQSHRAKVEFLGRVDENKWPQHVLCKITPEPAIGPDKIFGGGSRSFRVVLEPAAVPATET